MTPRGVGTGLPRRLAAALALIASVAAACDPPPDCSVATIEDLVPESGAHFGVGFDWASDDPIQITSRLGKLPAAYVVFAEFPMSQATANHIASIGESISQVGGIMVLTLEPFGGLDEVTPASSATLASRLAAINDGGTPILLRFAHEMNGSWYPWGQQPAAYIDAFREIADAVHSAASLTAMMWAPNYGGGYPFTGGAYEAQPGTSDHAAMDTDGDGVVTMADDPYTPFHPGDDVVDWVGMSLYHWGSAWPWGENEMPEAGKFSSQLTGTYVGLGGDDSALPDFYAEHSEAPGKPLAIPETAAFFAPDNGGPSELDLKQSWWRQPFDDDIHTTFPNIGLIGWFDISKFEAEVNGIVDWRVTHDPAVSEAFTADLPEWVQYGQSVGC